MTGRSVNIYLQEETYNQLRKLTGERKISRFVDEAIIEKLAKEQEKNKEELKKKWSQVIRLVPKIRNYKQS